MSRSDRDPGTARPVVRALAFDVFGTLVDWRPTLAAAFDGLLVRRGVDGDGAVLADRWRRAYLDLAAGVAGGSRPYVPLDELLQGGLDRVLDGVVADVSADEAVSLLARWSHFPPWPDVGPALERLRSQSLLIGLSNADPVLGGALARRAGLPFDLILGADPVRTYKPDPAVYLHAVEVTGLRPEEIMMAAAHNRDLEAAARLGFRTSFVRRPTEYGAGQTTDLEPTGDWDVVVDDLGQLVARLSELGAERPGAGGRRSTGPADEGVGSAGSESPASTAALTRLRAATLAVVVAACSFLAFSQGYRAGSTRDADIGDRAGTGAPTDQPAIGQPAEAADGP